MIRSHFYTNQTGYLCIIMMILSICSSVSSAQENETTNTDQEAVQNDPTQPSPELIELLKEEQKAEKKVAAKKEEELPEVTLSGKIVSSDKSVVTLKIQDEYEVLEAGEIVTISVRSSQKIKTESDDSELQKYQLKVVRITQEEVELLWLEKNQTVLLK